MAVPKGPRSFHVGPYHYCGSCNDRRHLSDLEWQRGVLKCPDCYDRGIFPLVGERELAMAKALEAPTTELQPNAKLTSPDSSSGGEDEIFF